jgi:hypothetical protein
MVFNQQQFQRKSHPTSWRYLRIIFFIFFQICLIFLLIPGTRPYAASVELGLLQSLVMCSLFLFSRRRFSPKLAILIYLPGAVLLAIFELIFVMRHPFLPGLIGSVISSMIINPLLMNFLLGLYGQDQQNAPQQNHITEEISESTKRRNENGV